ncbi:inorganic phosphate transporter [Parasutterella secunda]|uniref:Phosphate transporter n=1 Tax=Parasutterella secunda TaxID=626947 RepID=A0ABS2GUA4_9BURK|nr:inorganic phosphate transporter [Parasutterella secunda]MBM6928964.1 inorganic phosphate transporter [Parasutterella secunda]
MEYYFLALLGFLGLVAIFDIFVGVSNDAVNFLNSALGCRIASFKTIMLVASIGVMLGATFSSGMMEIARSGVFNPQMFTFSEIIVIFFAVMVTDIILLDLFNSLGLPTSTTVSIVFELLGSALAAAAYTLMMDGASLANVIDYINSSKSLTIVSGILISVAVAFVTGAVVQYITRLIFTFNFEKMYRRVGGIFAGIALTAIFYFLVMKGAKGASFMQPEWIRFMDVNTWPIVGTLFVVLSIVFHVLIIACNINIFKIVILAGTFSLAFAFAGNDLVNFVGVPLAAWDSYQEWQASGVAAEAFTMEGLLKPTVAATGFLLFSGFVMVLTLWFSKKAQIVIQTSINLSSSNSGEQEQFGSSLPGRMIVRASMGLGKVIHQIIPMSVQKGIDRRFEPKKLERGETPLPFDYVRASINLVVSAALIASATSLQLPLSTTYVTFMVAMGSSFADGAWDRETAVYRISGVLTVISGWFLTALSASTMAAIVCAFTLWGGEIAALILAVGSTFLLIRSNLRAKLDTVNMRADLDTRYDAKKVRELVDTKTDSIFAQTLSVYRRLVTEFLNDNESALHHVKSDSSDLFDKVSADRGLYYRMANSSFTPSKKDFDARYCYYRIFTNIREVGRSLQALSKQATDHIANRHRIFQGELKNDLLSLVSYLEKITTDSAGKQDIQTVLAHSNEAVELIDHMQAELLRRIPNDGISVRGSELYLNFLVFARELVNRFAIAAVLEQRLDKIVTESSKS